MSIRAVPTRLGGPSLAAAYMAGNPEVTPFFGADPRSLSAYRAQASRVAPRFPRPEREVVASILHPASERAAERLERFVEGGGVVVTTGQQTGLFTGPLYTVYKALSVVSLAAALERELGTIVLPVFWSASEDHDWEEIDHAYLADFRGGVRRVDVAPSYPAPLSAARRALPDDFEHALEAVRQIVAGEEHAEDVLTWIREAYREGSSFSDGFLRLIRCMFARFDLLTIDAADPILKRRSAPVLAAALEQAQAQEAAVALRTRAITDAGYAPQVAVLPDAANLFLEDESGRRRLHRRGGGWRAHGSDRTRSTEELHEILRESPEKISPNVLLRPVVESAVLPVVSYVGGPGEIAYFAQAAPLFEMYEGLRMPMIVPRASFVLLRSETQELLGSLGKRWSDLAAPEHRLARGVAREQLPPDAADALAELRSGLVGGFGRVLSAAAGIDPTLAGSVGASRNAALLEAARVEQKLLRAVQRLEAGRIRRMLSARAELYPHGAPQERVLNVIPYLARYGLPLFDQILTQITSPWQSTPEAGS